MRWLEALRPIAGPLLDSATSWLRGAGHEAPDSSMDAVRLLVAAIDEVAFQDDSPEADQADRRLVEGGGALLGLALLDRHGGRHVGRGSAHRVLLGRHGSFDPFRAIDAALDADAPDEELRTRLLLADAEAEGTGPVARIVRAFDERLQLRRPELQLEDRFEFEVVLTGGLEIDLARIAELTAENPKVLEGALDRVLGLLPGAERVWLPWAEAAERILPRVVGHGFLERLGPQGAGLFQQPLHGDLCATLQLRYDGRSRYVRADELENWIRAGAQPKTRALERLAARSERARFARVEADIPLVIARTGDGLDAARLLLPNLAAVLAAELSGPLFVAAPHRDTLLASNDAPGLQPHVADAFARAPHAISRQILPLASIPSFVD